MNRRFAPGSAASTLLLVLFLGVLAARCTTVPIGPDTPVRVPTATPRQVIFGPTPTRASGNDVASNPGGGIPELVTKPPVPRTTYQGCPAQGDGGDPELNRLKNRVDTGEWRRASVAAVLALTWPKNIEYKRHSSWTAADRAAVARYEGLPLQLEGYLAGAKTQGPESCNCHAVDYVDFHLWLVDSPNKPRSQSVVVEVTPRMRAQHPGWTIDRLRTLMTSQTRIRVSGWLLMDQEHPDQIGKTRGSIWELHPILEIEVAQIGGWAPLDNATSAPIPAQPVPTQPDEPPPIVDTPEPGLVTPTPNAAGTGASSTAVQITRIVYDGAKANESDEYVEIRNTGATPVTMDGWTLSDAADHVFRWNAFTLQVGQTIRVYTGEVHRDSGGFSFNSGQPIWNNKGDRAYLRDVQDNIVATFRYGASP
jgi:hypothetical protein